MAGEPSVLKPEEKAIILLCLESSFSMAEGIWTFLEAFHAEPAWSQDVQHHLSSHMADLRAAWEKVEMA